MIRMVIKNKTIHKMLRIKLYQARKSTPDTLFAATTIMHFGNPLTIDPETIKWNII